MKVTVSDCFANHNVGGIGVFVVDGNSELWFKLVIGLKKYTCDPISVDIIIFGRLYGFLEDMEEGVGEII